MKIILTAALLIAATMVAGGATAAENGSSYNVTKFNVSVYTADPNSTLVIVRGGARRIGLSITVPDRI